MFIFVIDPELNMLAAGKPLHERCAFRVLAGVALLKASEEEGGYG